MRLALVAVALMIAGPAAAQSIPAVHIASFSNQSSAAVASTNGLFSITATTVDGEPGGFMMAFAGQVVPPDGIVQPVVCFAVDAGPDSSSLSMGGYPGSAPTGFAWAFSTGPDCQHKVATPINFVSIAYR